jgi:hypothetical protein
VETQIASKKRKETDISYSNKTQGVRPKNRQSKSKSKNYFYLFRFEIYMYEYASRENNF